MDGKIDGYLSLAIWPNAKQRHCAWVCVRARACVRVCAVCARAPPTCAFLCHFGQARARAQFLLTFLPAYSGAADMAIGGIPEAAKRELQAGTLHRARAPLAPEDPGSGMSLHRVRAAS